MYVLSNIIPPSSAGHPGPGGGVQLCRHFGVRDPAPVCRESVWHHQGQDKVRRRGDIPHQGSIHSCALWIFHLLSVNFGVMLFNVLCQTRTVLGQVKGAVRQLCSDTNKVVKSRPFWCTTMGLYFRKIMQGSERDVAWCCLVWRLTLLPLLCAEVRAHWVRRCNSLCCFTKKLNVFDCLQSKWDFLDFWIDKRVINVTVKG